MRHRVSHYNTEVKMDEVQKPLDENAYAAPRHNNNAGGAACNFMAATRGVAEAVFARCSSAFSVAHFIRLMFLSRHL